MLTALEASKEVGLSKEAILKALKAGRLSGQKDGKNQWIVDRAELLRVYPEQMAKNVNGTHQSIVSTDGTQQELDHLRDRCKLLEERLKQRDEDVKDYRERLDLADKRYTALLPPPKEEVSTGTDLITLPSAPPAEVKAAKSKWRGWLTTCPLWTPRKKQGAPG